MNSSSNSTPETPTNRLTLSPEEVDKLLHQVKNDLRSDNFDRSDSKLIQQMIECMGDTRGMVRLGFAEALGVVGKNAAAPLMEALASHPNVVVQRAAAKTLTLIGDLKSIPVLLNSFLHDEDQVVRNSSIGALARMGETVVPELLEIIADRDRDETIKGHAAWALAFIGVKAKEQIYAAINSSSDDLRSAVVGAVLKIAEEEPEERAFKLLMDSLQDPATNVRSEAAAAVGNLGYKPAIPILIELLDNSELESRKSAALALMKIKDTGSIENLESAMEKESIEEVTQVIKLAINQLKKASVDDEWD